MTPSSATSTQGLPAQTPFFDRALETLDRRGLEHLQLEKVRAHLPEVAARNVFYRRKWQEAGIDAATIRTLDDFRRLPFTAKQELVADQQTHPPFGTNLTYPLKRYTRFHLTSGTTGRPLRWLDTPESWEWWIRCWLYVYRAAGVGPQDRIFFAFSFGPFIGFWSAFDAGIRLGALCLPGGGQDSILRLRTLIDNEATVLVCTPSYALHLAQVAREHGIDTAATPIRLTIHAGEPGACIPSTKRRIEEAWGARCFDHHGLTEVGPVGFECLAQPGVLRVNEAEFISEVVDPRTGEPAEDGQGELVLTNLGRWGSPVFRYRTGDLVRVGPGGCACGRRFARLEGGILGRVDDMLIIRGVNVFPSVVDNIVRRHPEVDEYRIEVYQQAEMPQIRVLLEIDQAARGREASDRTVAAIAEGIRTSVGLRVETRAVPAGTLPRFEHKARRVVRTEP
jgi:phenylacetate-CoA ligase